MTTINISVIIIANFLGILLTLTMIISRPWKLVQRSSEGEMLRLMGIVIIIACITDPIVFAADGHPGILCRNLVLFGNSFLFMLNVGMGVIFLRLVQHHLGESLLRWERFLVILFPIISSVVIIINFFYPIAFNVTPDNRYERGPYHFIFVVLIIIIFSRGCITYVSAKKMGGIFKFFPVWQFIVPIILGVTIQSLHYGLSLIWPCGAISFAGILMAFQNESVYEDQLTGSYNSFYLKYVSEIAKKKSTYNVAAVMIDLNSFKAINDNYGHLTGDRALQKTVRILEKATGKFGSVIRYGGDEFVLLLRTQDEKRVKKIIDTILLAMADSNEKEGVEYRLSASFGYGFFDLAEKNVEDVIGIIDKKMYTDKEEYYKANPQFNRRK